MQSGDYVRRGRYWVAAVAATGILALLALSCLSADTAEVALKGADSDAAGSSGQDHADLSGRAAALNAGATTPSTVDGLTSPSTAGPAGTPTTAAAVTTPVAPLPPGFTVAGNLYAETMAGKLSPSVADVPPRVYVPNSDGQTLSIIDPATGALLVTQRVGVMPHHVVPSWDMTKLYVLDTAGNMLVPIDPRTAALGAPIPVEDPYNLYFTPDGSTALVIAERYRRIDARDPHTWQLLWSVSVPYAGVNHGDFSPDGRYFYATCEFSGWVVKIDLVERRIVAEAKVGSQPIDLRLSPDASKLYVAEQARGGVLILRPEDLHEVAFVPTGAGTHGLFFSRDVTKLYATNRVAGSVSVIDLATDAVAATWTVPRGGSPDMGSVSADGSQFWVSGRNHGEVYAFDTTTGALVHRIKTGPGAHGLSLFPQPGRFSLGHTGNYR